MSSIATGYDLSVTTFSPDGRVFQVEYAGKAVDNSRTVVGIKCKYGIVLGVEKLVTSKMILKGSNRRLHSVHRHSGLTICHVNKSENVKLVENECINFYKEMFTKQMKICILLLSCDLSLYQCRVYGVHDEAKDKDFELELSWVCDESKRQHEKGVEKLVTSKMILKGSNRRLHSVHRHSGLYRRVYGVHDEAKDKDFELELSWVCDESKRQHEKVPDNLVEQAKAAAQAALEEMDAD
uniref:Proteasome subunit alpha type n=2 Tax=Oryza punctata TaxID=4537 RepID=A0A0E0KQP0_ORYPU